MENKQKLVTILIIISAIILLLLVLAVSILLKSQQPASTSSQTQQTSQIPSSIPVSEGLQNGTPVPDAAENYEKLPFTLNGTFPPALWSQMTSHVDEAATSYDIALTRPEDSFSIEITTLSTTPGFEQKERVKYIPSPLAYNATEFIQIAEVNGQKLFVSRTGAANIVVENELGTYRSIPSLEPETDYFVLQLYPDGFSEYISAFNVDQKTAPSYDNHYIIKYHITSPNDATKWSQYQTLIAESIEGINRNVKE